MAEELSRVELALKRARKKSVSSVTSVEVCVPGGASSQQFWVTLEELVDLKKRYPDKWL